MLLLYKKLYHRKIQVGNGLKPFPTHTSSNNIDVIMYQSRRGRIVAECSGLLNRQPLKRFKGSNPFLSAFSRRHALCT